MANHKSAIKRHRQSLKRNSRNHETKSAVRTAVKAAKALVASGDVEGAKKALVAAEKVLAKAAAKGILHSRNAARRTSRLAAMVSTKKQ